MDRVLIVDDEPLVQTMLRKQLSREGYKIFTANNGKEGLAIIEKYDPPVIILDLRMPEMDGIELLQQLNQSYINQHSIIVLTGHGGDDEIEICYNLGVNFFLKKPVNFHQLKGLVSRSFKLMKANQEIKQLNSRLTSLMNHMPDLILECDHEYRLTYVSENVTKILGYHSDDIIGRLFSEFLNDEDATQFYFKFNKDVYSTPRDIRGIFLHLLRNDGSFLPVQITAKAYCDENKEPKGIVAIARDLSDISQTTEEIKEIIGKNQIKIDQNLQIIEVDHALRNFFPANFSEANEGKDFAQYVTDQTLLSLIPFAFDQKENVPFPVEVKLEERDGKNCYFNVQLNYDAQKKCLLGDLTPAGTSEQISLMSKTLEEQKQELDVSKEALKQSVVMDNNMRSSILSDSKNMAAEILVIIKRLAGFAFQDSDKLTFDLFKQFMENKKLILCCDDLRLLANKVHGLKGTTGFLIPEAKQLCHKIEEIIKPLADSKLVLTNDILSLSRNFIFKIQEMLEIFQDKEDARFDISEMLSDIEQQFRRSSFFIQGQEELFSNWIDQRCSDTGALRVNHVEENLQVSKSGYNKLSQKVKNLFYMLSSSVQEEHLIEAGNLYNEFLDTHQRIIKVPLDLSRYERLIPAMAKEYNKDADFIFYDNSVLADREFWNACHEILNHVLKNSVIHGIETTKIREEKGKAVVGNIKVNLEEDALHVYMTVSDDGEGIDLKKVSNKILQQGIVTQGDLNKMTEEEIYNMVFVQGISTASELDDNAGRGIGLNAVQTAMNRYQGKCVIDSKPGSGVDWNFIFPKNNVSLPCFIVTIGDYSVAIPESNVESFNAFQDDLVMNIKQNAAYRYLDQVIPLADSGELFDKSILVEEQKLKRILILKPHQGKRIALMINDIMHHSILPILPLPEEFRDCPIYIGATTFKNDPVLVLNVSEIIEKNSLQL